MKAKKNNNLKNRKKYNEQNIEKNEQKKQRKTNHGNTKINNKMKELLRLDPRTLLLMNIRMIWLMTLCTDSEGQPNETHLQEAVHPN